MKIALIGTAVFFGLMVGSRAEAASILYGTTDLGAGLTFQKNPDGSTYGVTNGAGTVTYAFDKSPVTPINIQSVTADYPDYTVKILSLQSGPFQVGVNQLFDGVLGERISPSFETYTSGWIGGGNGFAPISDLNIHGQAVGLSFTPDVVAGAYANTTFAAFSAVGLMGHGGPASVADNLNNFIAPLPGVTLLEAGFIDDSGRIIATSQDHAYLLTPVALGEPATVPEPTTLAAFGTIGLLLGIRSLRRRKTRA